MRVAIRQVSGPIPRYKGCSVRNREDEADHATVTIVEHEESARCQEMIGTIPDIKGDCKDHVAFFLWVVAGGRRKDLKQAFLVRRRERPNIYYKRNIVNLVLTKFLV